MVIHTLYLAVGVVGTVTFVIALFLISENKTEIAQPVKAKVATSRCLKVGLHRPKQRCFSREFCSGNTILRLWSSGVLSCAVHDTKCRFQRVGCFRGDGSAGYFFNCF